MALKPYRGTRRWKKLRLQVLRRDGYTCVYCGDVATQADHVWPRSKGGEDTLENCVAACASCNSLKRDTMGVFSATTATPPALADHLSPKRTNRSKSVQNSPTSVRVDHDSPFIAPSDQGGI